MSTETLPAVAPAEPTTPMRPSEALRLGRLTRPLDLVGEDLNGQHSACARGAIIEGYGLTDSFKAAQDGFSASLTSPVEEWFRTAAPSAFRVIATMPCRHAPPGPLMVAQIIPHLNDSHEWDDNQIVAWLESLGL